MNRERRGARLQSDGLGVPDRAVNPTPLAYALKRSRDWLGFDYRRRAYLPDDIRRVWEHYRYDSWASVVPSAQNSREAAVRDVAVRMPGHEEAYCASG